MRYVDADGHVEESPATFDDKYLDPNFRAQRPRVVAVDGLVYWDIDEQLFPRRVGRGCNNLGTPTSYDGKPAIHSAGKPEISNTRPNAKIRRAWTCPWRTDCPHMPVLRRRATPH